MAAAGPTSDRAAKDTSRPAKNMRRNEIIKRTAFCICLLSVVATVLYYTSKPGQWGMMPNDWYATFNLANNLIALSVVIIMFTNPTKGEKIIIGWLFIPYFIIKILYLIAAHWDFSIIRDSRWCDIWASILPTCFLISLIHSLYLRYGQEED